MSKQINVLVEEVIALLASFEGSLFPKLEEKVTALCALVDASHIQTIQTKMHLLHVTQALLDKYQQAQVKAEDSALTLPIDSFMRCLQQSGVEDDISQSAPISNAIVQHLTNTKSELETQLHRVNRTLAEHQLKEYLEQAKELRRSLLKKGVEVGFRVDDIQTQYQLQLKALQRIDEEAQKIESVYELVQVYIKRTGLEADQKRLEQEIKACNAKILPLREQIFNSTQQEGCLLKVDEEIESFKATFDKEWQYNRLKIEQETKNLFFSGAKMLSNLVCVPKEMIDSQLAGEKREFFIAYYELQTTSEKQTQAQQALDIIEQKLEALPQRPFQWIQNKTRALGEFLELKESMLGGVREIASTLDAKLFRSRTEMDAYRDRLGLLAKLLCCTKGMREIRERYFLFESDKAYLSLSQTCDAKAYRQSAIKLSDTLSHYQKCLDYVQDVAKAEESLAQLNAFCLKDDAYSLFQSSLHQFRQAVLPLATQKEQEKPVFLSQVPLIVAPKKSVAKKIEYNFFRTLYASAPFGAQSRLQTVALYYTARELYRQSAKPKTTVLTRDTSVSFDENAERYFWLKHLLQLALELFSFILLALQIKFGRQQTGLFFDGNATMSKALESGTLSIRA